MIFEYFTTLLAAGHNWQLLVTSGFIWSHHATIELPFSGHFLVTSICFGNLSLDLVFGKAQPLSPSPTVLTA